MVAVDQRGAGEEPIVLASWTEKAVVLRKEPRVYQGINSPVQDEHIIGLGAHRGRQVRTIRLESGSWQRKVQYRGRESDRAPCSADHSVAGRKASAGCERLASNGAWAGPGQKQSKGFRTEPDTPVRGRQLRRVGSQDPLRRNRKSRRARSKPRR